MSDESTQEFKHLLASKGHRVTEARLKIFKLLLSPEPQSIGQLRRKAGQTIERVSLYRNIALFEELGIAHRIYIGWKYKIELSDSFVAHHHHMSCLTCGRVIDIKDEAHINAFISDISERFGFTPRHHQFEIDGYCESCTKSKDS